MIWKQDFLCLPPPKPHQSLANLLHKPLVTELFPLSLLLGICPEIQSLLADFIKN